MAEGSAEEHGDVYQTTSQADLADLQDMMYFVMFLSAETSFASKWHFEFDNPSDFHPVWPKAKTDCKF